MYWWELVGHDTAGASPRSGIGGDLALIMRQTEADLAKLTGFVADVNEVVPRMSVLGLDAVYVATGRRWLGRRDKSGVVCWEERYCPADSDSDSDSDSDGDAGCASAPVTSVTGVIGPPAA